MMYEKQFDIPKYLYHGTSMVHSQQIVKFGLRPRYLTGVDTNWGLIPSTMDMVYLSNTVPFYYALQTKEATVLESVLASESVKVPFLTFLNTPIVLEISTEDLNKNLFYPDEDYISLEYLDRYADVEESIKLARRLVRKCRHLWMDSLYSLGVCAYQGVIPAKAITQVCVFDQDQNYDLASHFYRSPVTFSETSMIGNTYQRVVEWIFGKLTDDDFKSEYSREGLTVLPKGEFLQKYGI